jgi:GNAT superfamily N-acetyltransferase
MTRAPLAVQLRPIRPDDLPELRAGLRRLSPDTRFQRFHAAIDDLSPAQWAYLTQVDGHDHVAFVACTRECVGDLLPGAIVGVGRYIRAADAEARAEVAFLVYDRAQGRGVGRALRDALVSAARERGITTFRAHILSGNFTMRRLLCGGGLRIVREDDGTYDARLGTAHALLATA